MAHQIETRNGIASFAYAGETPWHSLGQRVDGDATKDYKLFLKAANMDWNVRKTPLFLKDQNGDMQVTNDSFGVIRDIDNRYLGTVGPQWEPIQPASALAWFQPVIDSGSCTFETAGSLRDGKVIFALAKISGEQYEVIKGDPITRYCLLSTSFDGSQSTRCGFTNTRVVCANTLAMAHNKEDAGNKLIRIRHHRHQMDVLNKVREIMVMATQQFEATLEQYRFLAKSRIVSHRDLVEYVTKVLDIEVDENGNMPTRSVNRVKQISDLAYNGKGSELAAGTWWSAYNAVTEFLSWEAGRNPDNRYSSLWFGQGADMNRRALELATTVAA
jgi:phage/plasmid-like protein (TIGR03299 family)